MSEITLPIRVCRVDTPAGEKDYVACVPDNSVFSRGLIPEAIVGVLQRPIQQGEPITPNIFMRNRAFVQFMHDVIAHRGPTVPALLAEAKRQMDGLVVVVDQRTHTPGGAVPPEDIIGAFEVRGGKLISYRPNENHKILSANGFVQLGAELQQCLLEELGKRR